MTNITKPLWQPNQAQIEKTLSYDFMTQVNQQYHLTLADYHELYQWSIDNKESFWSMLWTYSGVLGKKGETILENAQSIEHARWFPQASLNFAENLLRKRGQDIAIHFRAENQAHYDLSYDELYHQVACVAAWMKAKGVQADDRVAGYLPNMPETIVVMLATASLGAIWTSTSPDFGEESVIERFGQTTPKLLFAADGYFYNGKTLDIRDKVSQVSQAISSIEHTVIIPLTEMHTDLPGLNWQDILVEGLALTRTDTDEEGNDYPHIDFTPRAFDDPLYILYSSGTTGKPKCITHKVGGVLLQHLKEHKLHSDVQPGDKVFYFTTCGWMMWNWLVSALAAEATVVLYDGSPFYPDGNVLWDYAQEVDVTLFGTSAKYIDAMKNAQLEPAKTHDLTSLRTLCSTGSVLAPESFDYVYSHIKQDVCLSSISGGTDIVSCFVLGSPVLPVYRGESQCRGLGMAVDVFDDDGKPIRGEKGELVCTQTFPAQPCYFWGDENGEKYHNAYFAVYDNIWHHGDFIELTDHNGVIIYGRSDATLNPGGVRIGTAEIYRHVEQLDEVEESIVIGQDWDNDVRVVLFVVLQEGITLDDTLTKTIRNTIREKCTPRHMPAKVIHVSEIPRTKSGKIVELAVREVVHGRAVKNLHALANPEALALYKDLPELQV